MLRRWDSLHLLSRTPTLRVAASPRRFHGLVVRLHATRLRRDGLRALVTSLQRLDAHFQRPFSAMFLPLSRLRRPGDMFLWRARPPARRLFIYRTSASVSPRTA